MTTYDPAKGPVVWAQNVSRHEPHGLADVENVLLYDDPENKKRIRHGVKRDFGRSSARLVGFLAVAAPLYGPVGFSEGQHRGMEREFDPGEAYPVSALAFVVGAIVLGYFFWRWRNHGRLRDPFGVTVGVLYVVVALLTLYFGYSNADLIDGSTALYMSPVWVVLALSLLTVGYQVPSPRNPAKTWERFDIALLATEDREMLLNERTEALRVLADRGLLGDDVSVEELSARPLGELHVSMEAIDDQRR